MNIRKLFNPDRIWALQADLCFYCNPDKIGQYSSLKVRIKCYNYQKYLEVRIRNAWSRPSDIALVDLTNFNRVHEFSSDLAPKNCIGKGKITA